MIVFIGDGFGTLPDNGTWTDLQIAVEETGAVRLRGVYHVGGHNYYMSRDGARHTIENVLTPIAKLGGWQIEWES